MASYYRDIEKLKDDDNNYGFHFSDEALYLFMMRMRISIIHQATLELVTCRYLYFN